MLPLLALLAAPVLAAGPIERVPPVPALQLPAAPVIRLVVEPVPDARGFAFINEENRQAIALALEETKGAARVLNSDGPSAIFEGQSFLEVQAAAAPKLQQDLETLGLRVSRLDAVLDNALSTQKAVAIGTDADMAAAAARLMDNARHPADSSEDLGALLTAVESQPVAHLSPETRRQAARAVYGGLVNAANAHNAVTGDLRMAARKRWIDSHGGQVGSYVDMELAAHAELHRPENLAKTAAIRAVISRASAAIQKLDADVSAPLLVELLPHADHALLEDLARDPQRARAFVASYLQMLRTAVHDTTRLVEEYVFSADEARRKEIRIPQHSGGIGSMDVAKVAGHRTAVWAYDTKAWVFSLGELNGSAWGLLGVSRAAAQALKAAFVDLLVESEPLTKRVDDALRAKELDDERKGFDRMAGEFLKDPKLKDQLDAMREQHLKDREKRYDEYSKVEGNEVLDRSLRALSWFGPYDHLRPGFSTDQYVQFAAQILRDAAARTGPAMFKLVAHTALRFAEDARKYAWPQINGTARDEVEALEREVKARAAADGLKVYP